MMTGEVNVTEQDKLEMLNQTHICLIFLFFCSVKLALDRIGHRYERFLLVFDRAG